jgi:predicted Ser/Thr protein kinase
MSNTIKLPTCPKCGAPIPAGAPQGLCPKCVLLGAATATEQGVPPTATSEIPSIQRITAAFPQLEILELIGRGGMGFVFKARQPNLDRFVALKLLPDKLAKDAQFAERFNREGRVLAKLNHPNIVSVFDFGQTGGFYYLTMEYVDGVNLRQAMRAGRFSPSEALSIVPKVCEALQYAHEQGILHRDIKPENILLDAKGRVKIADFGIAKLVGEDQPNITLTNTGAALGTPHYMAPEQLEKPSTVDHRADIYSLGVVFYEMLTGELPIGRFAPPSSKTPVGTSVDEVVFRTLEKDRERRFQSAGEMKSQVEHIGASGGVAEGSAAGRMGDEGERRYSRWSIYGALSVGLSLPVPFTMMVALLAGLGGLGSAELLLALGSVAMPGLGGTLLGWLGLNEIRESGGRVRGLPLAMFATLTWPLIALMGITAGLPMLFLVPGGNSGWTHFLGRILVLVLPAAVLSFALWTVHATARWATHQPVAQRRGVLKWVFIGVLVIGIGIVLVTNPGRREASPPRPEPVSSGTGLGGIDGPQPIRANFRVGKGQAVTFEVVRGERENFAPVPNMAGFVVAPDDERGRFSVVLTPEPAGTNRLRWRMSVINEDGSANHGATVDLGELISMVPTNHLHTIEEDSSFGLYLTRAYQTAGTNGVSPLAELSLDVRSQSRGRVGASPDSTLVGVGSTNWARSLKDYQKAAGRRAQPGEVLAYQWLKSPAGTNTTNSIRFTFTSVELRNEDGQQWLAMGYVTDVHGDCEVVFRVDGNGFKPVTRKTSWRATPAGSPPIEYSGIQWLVPPGIDAATMESFRNSLAEALVAKSFVIPEGEQRPLLRFPVGKVGDLSVGIGAKLRRPAPAPGASVERPPDSAPWVQMTINSARIRIEDREAKPAVIWLDLEYSEEAHGACELSFFSHGGLRGSPTMLQGGVRQQDRAGLPPIVQRNLEFRLPDGITHAEAMAFRDRVASRWQGKPLVVQPGASYTVIDLDLSGRGRVWVEVTGVNSAGKP